MKPGLLKKIAWVLCGILVIVMFPVAWKLKAMERKAEQLSADIQQTKQITLRYDKQASTIRNQLEGRQRGLEQNTVSLEDPIVWCYEWLHNRVGLSSDIEIECIGTKPLGGMAIGRAARNAMEGTMGALVPYAARLDIRETTLEKLQYILEQIEARDGCSIIQYLRIQPSETEKTFSATAIVYNPSFYYPQDGRDLRKFFDSPPPLALKEKDGLF